MDGYQVGNFPPPWLEWNDRYRDTIRDFWRAQSGGIRDVASRIAGVSGDSSPGPAKGPRTGQMSESGDYRWCKQA